MMDRNTYVAELQRHIGKPYHWGFMGPDSFDCSGLVCRCLNAAGANIVSKLCAADLVAKFGANKVQPGQAPIGTLFFYGPSPAQITHVMSVLFRWANGMVILAGARHGDATTVSTEIAAQQKACVDTVFGYYQDTPLYWTANFQFALDPFRGQ